MINIIGIRRSGLHIVSDYITEISKLQFNNNINHNLYLQKELKVGQIYLFEDADLIEFNKMTPQIDIAQVKNVIVIRDPLNMCASRIKHYSLMSSEGLYINPSALHQWKLYFDCYTHKKKLTGIETIYVNYNKFITSAPYRSEITNQLNGVKDHKESKSEARILDSININGGGSSFDGMHAKVMDNKYIERYKYYRELSVFQNLFTKDELKIIEDNFDIHYDFNDVQPLIVEDTIKEL